MAQRHGNPMRAVFFVIHEFVPGSGRFRLRSGTRACSAGAHHAACMVVGAEDADLAGMVAGLPAGAGGAGPSCLRPWHVQVGDRCGCRWRIGLAAGLGGPVLPAGRQTSLWAAMGHRQCALVKLYLA